MSYDNEQFLGHREDDDTCPDCAALQGRRPPRPGCVCGREGGEGRMSDHEHKWTDVRGWGGALPGTVQCDLCNRVVSPTDPRGSEKLESSCAGGRA